MNGTLIAFYGIAVFILTTALLAVLSTRLFRSAIWLLFSLIGIAGLYFLLEVNFVAAVQIIVYVGGIVVLIIFSIFLTQQSDTMPRPKLLRVMCSLIAVLLGLGFTYNLIYHHPFATLSAQPFVVSPESIGTAMLSTTDHGFVLPFEVVSILLLAAMIGCIVIAMKPAAIDQPALSSINNNPGIELPGPVVSMLNPITENEEVEK